MADATRFLDLDVVDAVEPFQITLKRADVENFSPLDPAHCVISNGARRQSDIIQAVVRRTVVFVRFRFAPDLWVRYILSKDDRDVVSAYDKGVLSGGLINNRTVRLLAPAGKMRLGGRKGEAPGTEVRSGRENQTLPTHRPTSGVELVQV